MEKTVLPFILGAILILILLGLLNDSFDSKELAKDYKLVYGKISYFGFTAGGATAAPEYSYMIGTTKLSGTFNSNVFCRLLSESDESTLSTIKFPILYSPSNPKISRILLSKDDYIKYGINEIDKELDKIRIEYFDCDKVKVLDFGEAKKIPPPAKNN